MTSLTPFSLFFSPLALLSIPQAYGFSRGLVLATQTEKAPMMTVPLPPIPQQTGLAECPALSPLLLGPGPEWSVGSTSSYTSSGSLQGYLT